jgi:hypothetical protein
MFLDVVDLRSFYAQPLGVVTRRILGRALRSRFSNVHGLSVLGLGYATPYLGAFREEAERCIAIMPAAQGVVRWPSAEISQSTKRCPASRLTCGWRSGFTSITP